MPHGTLGIKHVVTIDDIPLTTFEYDDGRATSTAFPITSLNFNKFASELEEHTKLVIDLVVTHNPSFVPVPIASRSPFTIEYRFVTSTTFRMEIT